MLNWIGQNTLIIGCILGSGTVPGYESFYVESEYTVKFRTDPELFLLRSCKCSEYEQDRTRAKIIQSEIFIVSLTMLGFLSVKVNSSRTRNQR